MREICFTATQSEPTKVLLTTEDDNTFKASWEENDQVTLHSQTGLPITATYKGNNQFAASSSQSGVRNIRAVYPAGPLNFGNIRVQNGNNYNASYDIMASEYQNVDLSSNDATFLLDRKTAISYFHFTSELDSSEKVNSALICSSKNIVADEVEIDSSGNIKESIAPDYRVLISFSEGTNPSGNDFKLWFNTFPVFNATYSILVDTPNHILRMTNTGVNHNSGIIYVTNPHVPITAWKEKINPTDYNWEQVTGISNISVGDYIIIANNSSKYMSTASSRGPKIMGTDIQVLLIGKGVIENTYSLYTINIGQNMQSIGQQGQNVGYLYNDGLSSTINTQHELNDNSSWSISFVDGYANISNNSNQTQLIYNSNFRIGETNDSRKVRIFRKSSKKS